jgi:hypothetical protein
MEEKRLAYRMYFFVPYNISPIQQAIQAGHAGMEYVYTHQLRPELIHFMDDDKTWVVLNGGTTNSKIDEEIMLPFGTLNQIQENLQKNNIDISSFYEPDLNDALTAVCFLADERVWDYKNYPDFFDFIVEVKMTVDAAEQMPAQNYIMLKGKTSEELKIMFPEWYPEWVKFLGGEKNLFLRELLRGKKLA